MQGQAGPLCELPHISGRPQEWLLGFSCKAVTHAQLGIEFAVAQSSCEWTCSSRESPVRALLMQGPNAAQFLGGLMEHLDQVRAT